MQKKYLIIIAVAVLALLAALVYWVFSAAQRAYVGKTEAPGFAANNSDNSVNNVPAAPEKNFTITAKNFSFSPSEIRVKQGDKVKIALDNTEGFHDWVVDEFSAKTIQIQAPAKTETEFTADKVGTFEFYCSVGEHRKMGMTGKLIVEE